MKTLLITGATDGIGLLTATKLAQSGHRVLLHGRSAEKLDAAQRAVRDAAPHADVDVYRADLSRLADVAALADAINRDLTSLDVLINNAGVFNTPQAEVDGLDVRFTVNTVAPYLLAKRLLTPLGSTGRIVNLSSAAQAPVDLQALAGRERARDDFDAYAQSKLALTMWTRALADELGDDGPVVVAVNPGSLLGTKMVKNAFGSDGGDVNIGADILVRAALSDEFAHSTGLYFDNDAGHFAPPHADGIDGQKCAAVVDAIEAVLAEH
ncbi:MAG: SDR family NAD(P)-dependent oxidoreductase [Pseudomonadota bacterium]